MWENKFHAQVKLQLTLFVSRSRRAILNRLAENSAQKVSFSFPRGFSFVFHAITTAKVRANKGRAIAQAVSRRLPRFDPRSGHVGFVADIVALGQVFSEYFGFS
jgi:hypothetical protein